MRITVFEHQSIRIGMEWDGQVFTAAHWRALARFHGKRGSRYYQLLHNGVRFKQFVGVLQIGSLTLEILPKTEAAAPEVWRRVLLEMLQISRIIKVDTASRAQLAMRPHWLLDVYFNYFLEVVQRLLARGLVRQYQEVSGNEKAWKGQVQFAQQIRRNFIHRERFYVQRDVYGYSHTANQMIYQALEILLKNNSNLTIKNKASQLLGRFPKMTPGRFTDKDFRQVLKNKKLSAYREALEISYLLLQNYHPDIRHGRHHLLAIMFDMNQLFEAFIYAQLRKTVGDQIQFSRQRSTLFWQQQKIRPDIVAYSAKETVILDTKWKLLSNSTPGSSDIKQIYVYQQYYNATRGILIYPGTGDQINQAPISFHPYPGNDTPGYCQIYFVNIIKNGQLNRDFGKDIIS